MSKAANDGRGGVTGKKQPAHGTSNNPGVTTTGEDREQLHGVPKATQDTLSKEGGHPDTETISGFPQCGAEIEAAPTVDVGDVTAGHFQGDGQDVRWVQGSAWPSSREEKFTRGSDHGPDRPEMSSKDWNSKGIEVPNTKKK